MENLSLKVIALFFAVFLWLIVINIDDPVDTQTFDNIPVEVKNEQVVKSKGKMYQILDGTENVSVKVTAKREILEKLTSSDFSAVADMQEMQINSLIPIKVSVKRYSSECKAEASPNNLVVEINDVKQKVFPLTVSVSGTPQNGCIIGNMTVNPEKITIKGSEPLVESIEKAVVKVDVTGRADSGTVQGNLVLYDSQGNIVDQSKLSNNLNTEKGIQVEIQMLNTKDVPITYQQPENLKENYICTGWTCEPQTIQVSGTKEMLDTISDVELTALFAIPFFLYRGLGLTGGSFWELVLVQCLVLVLSRIIMLPGNAGGAEGSFYLFMGPLFGRHLAVGLVLWRFAAFLEVLLLGGAWSVLRFAQRSAAGHGT